MLRGQIQPEVLFFEEHGETHGIGIGGEFEFVNFRLLHYVDRIKLYLNFFDALKFLSYFLHKSQLIWIVFLQQRSLIGFIERTDSLVRLLTVLFLRIRHLLLEVIVKLVNSDVESEDDVQRDPDLRQLGRLSVVSICEPVNVNNISV